MTVPPPVPTDFRKPAARSSGKKTVLPLTAMPCGTSLPASSVLVPPARGTFQIPPPVPLVKYALVGVDGDGERLRMAGRQRRRGPAARWHLGDVAARVGREVHGRRVDGDVPHVGLARSEGAHRASAGPDREDVGTAAEVQPPVAGSGDAVGLVGQPGAERGDGAATAGDPGDGGAAGIRPEDVVADAERDPVRSRLAGRQRHGLADPCRAAAPAAPVAAPAAVVHVARLVDARARAVAVAGGARIPARAARAGRRRVRDRGGALRGAACAVVRIGLLVDAGAGARGVARFCTCSCTAAPGAGRLVHVAVAFATEVVHAVAVPHCPFEPHVLWAASRALRRARSAHARAGAADADVGVRPRASPRCLRCTSRHRCRRTGCCRWSKSRRTRRPCRCRVLARGAVVLPGARGVARLRLLPAALRGARRAHGVAGTNQRCTRRGSRAPLFCQVPVLLQTCGCKPLH